MSRSGHCPGWACLLMVLSGIALRAQTQPAVFRHLGSEAGGFTEDLINVIHKGSHGFMWFGTGRGLIRYDGRKIRWYRHDPENEHSISNNNIRVIYEDREGELWIGTNIGLNRMDRVRGQFHRLQPDPQGGFSLTESNVWSLHRDVAGHLWVGTDQGLWRLDGERTRRFVEEDGLSGIGITAIIEDGEGVLWVGTDHSGLNRLDPASDRFLPEAGTANLEIRRLRADRDGRDLWAASANGGIWCKRPGTAGWTATYWGNRGGEPVPALGAFEIDALGTLWVGAMEGLFRLDAGGSAVTAYHHQAEEPTSLANDAIQALFADESGLLWVATQNGGVDLLDRQAERFAYYELEGTQARALHQDGAGRLWVGGRQGLRRLDVATGQTELFLTSNNIRSLASSGAYLYAGTDNGLLRMPAGGGEAETLVTEYRIWQILPDPGEGLWLGTNKGLLRYDEEGGDLERFRVDPVQPDMLSHKVVTALAADRRGHLWIGTYGGGLNRLNKKTRQIKRYPGAPEDPNGLSAADIVHLCLDPRDRLWIATQSGGFDCLDQETGEFVRYTTREGLPDNVVMSIAADAAGLMWLSTSEGLLRFDPETENWSIFRFEDGVIIGGAVPGACLRAADGSLFLGGTNGLVRFNAHDLAPTAPPPIVFTDLVAGRRLTRDLLLSGQTVALAPDENTFSLAFSVLDYRSPSRQRFAFRRGHIDQEWIESDSRNFISYTEYLPYGGEGLLKVRGRNARGSWGEAQLKLVVQSPPWLKWLPLFGVLIIGALIWFVYLVSTWREKRKRAALEVTARLAEERRILAEERASIALREKEMERTLQIERAAILQEHLEQISTEVANDLHDGPLAELQGFGFRLGSIGESLERSDHKLVIEQLTDEALPGLCDSLRNICSDLLAPDFRFGLRAELDAHADIVEGRNPGLHIERRFDLVEGVLDPRSMAMIFRIYRTLLKNVVKHAQSTRVEVRLQDKGETLELVVADDGIGFLVARDWEELKRNKHYGMFMAHYFAETIGGTLVVDSSPGAGTSVSVTVPVRQGGGQV